MVTGGESRIDGESDSSGNHNFKKTRENLESSEFPIKTEIKT